MIKFDRIFILVIVSLALINFSQALPSKNIEVTGVLKSFDKNFVLLKTKNNKVVKVTRPKNFDGKGYKLGVAVVTLKTKTMDFYKLNKNQF